MKLNINFTKKTIIIASSIALGLILIITGFVLLFAKKSVKGTEAAKILLAREKMNTADTSFSWQEISNQTQDLRIMAQEIDESMVYADTSGDLGTLLYDKLGGKVYKKDGYFNFQDISGASYNGLVIESRLIGVEYEAEECAKLIDYLKNKLNIVDKWVKADSLRYYFLNVKDNCETILEKYIDDKNQQYSLRVLKRTTLEDAKCIYEMLYTDFTTQELTNPTYSVYIPGERYEYYYEHGGNSKDYLIAENENGYWNVFMPDEDDFSNVIINGDLAYSTTYDFEKQSLTYDSISKSSLREDIVSTEETGFVISVSALNGFKNILIKEEYVVKNNHYEDEYYEILYEHRNDLFFEMENGKTIKFGDTFTYNSKTMTVSDINLEYYTNPGFAFPQYDIKIGLDVEGCSLKERMALLKSFFNDMGITMDYTFSEIEETIIKNSEIVSTLPNCYTWNGYLMNSKENVIKGSEVMYKTWDDLFAIYTNFKDYEIVTGFDKGRISKSLDFGEIELFNLDFATYSNKQVTINNAVMTMEKSKLLVENTQYVLKIGLAKIDENNKYLSQNTVELKTLDNLQSVTYQKGDITVNGTATYDIPTILEEGKYVIVAYIATQDEGIRVSQMHAVAFVDTQTETIETTSTTIKAIQNQDKSINMVYATKLNFEITLNNKDVYTYQDVRRAMMTKILNYGYPIFDTNIQTQSGIDVLESDSMVIGTTYKMKFKIPTQEGVTDAYVFVTLESKN